MTEYLSALGRTMLTEMRNACTNDILRIGAGHSALQVTVGGKGIFDNKAARKVVEANSLSLYPGTPDMPVFEWHSPIDALIPVSSIDYTMRRYCRAGVRVQTLRTPTPDHMTAAVLGIAPAFAYLQDRFDGKPAPSNC